MLRFGRRQAELDFAISVAREACVLARRVQDELVHTTLSKHDRSPVTVADFAIQALVAFRLRERFETDPLVAEESARLLTQAEGKPTLHQVVQFLQPSLPSAQPVSVCDWIDQGSGQIGPRAWILDPIDGTKGFLRSGQYAMALALLENGRIQIGVLGCPRLSHQSLRQDSLIGQALPDEGTIIAAGAGEGCWAAAEKSDDFDRLRVSDCSDPRASRVLRSVETGHTNVGQMGELLETLEVQAPPVLLDSQAKYALLSAGRGDLLFRLISPQAPDYREKIWDQAAGSLLVEEAGGCITDLLGNSLDFSGGRELVHNHGILASNGILHAAALEALRRSEEEL